MARLLHSTVFAVLLAGPALADDAADCRNRDYPDLMRLPLCGAAIQAATDPRDRADLLLWRAAIHDRAGDLDAALADFAEAEALAPGWADPLVERSFAFYDRGDLDAALAELARARAVEPGSAYAVQESLNFLADAGRLEECLDLADEAMALGADNTYMQAYLGRCHQDAGQLDEAVAAYARAQELGLNEAFLHANLALLHLERGENDLAAEEARAALALDPAYASAHRTLAETLIAKGDLDGALAHAEEAAPVLGAADDGLANEVAWALYEAGRHEEGLALYERWLASVPDPSSIPTNMHDTQAHLLAALGRPAEAAEAFLIAAKAGGLEVREHYMTHLEALGFGRDMGFRGALLACAQTGAACHLAD